MYTKVGTVSWRISFENKTKTVYAEVRNVDLYKLNWKSIRRLLKSRQKIRMKEHGEYAKYFRVWVQYNALLNVNRLIYYFYHIRLIMLPTVKCLESRFFNVRDYIPEWPYFILLKYFVSVDLITNGCYTSWHPHFFNL